jgi:hypothetical protein
VYSLFPIKVDFPFTPLDEVEAFSVTCLRRIGFMDTARLVLNIKPEDVNPYVTAGSPIHIVWEGDGATDSFVGYVHSFRPISEGYYRRTLILAVSAAYPMYTETGRSFYRIGIHNIAEEVGDDYRFQVETDPHPLLQEQVLQQDDSDWAFLKRLADDWGYVLVFDGVTLIFRPLHTIIEENNRLAESEQVLFGLSPTGSNILSFTPTFTAAGDSPLAINVGRGVEPVTSQTIDWKQAGKGVFKQITTRSVTSELEGEMVATAKEAQTRFPFTAKANILYPARKKPLDAYRIAYEGQIITWTIHAVKHIVTGSNYVGEMILGSDGVDRSQDAQSGQLDISYLLKRNRRATRPNPVIIKTQPYYVGTGASAVVDDQRWKAQVKHSPVNDREAA